MKVIVTTQSGSRYTLDDRELTWRRDNARGWAPGAEGWSSEGDLNFFPEIYIGEPMLLETKENGMFYTTTVTNFENVED